MRVSTVNIGVPLPAGVGDQRVMLHLEIVADDLPEDVRALIDPAGHSFCRWVAT